MKDHKSEPGPRKRGPRKGDGGRPPLRLYNDPDRWIVIIALSLKDDPREQRSYTTLRRLTFCSRHTMASSSSSGPAWWAASNSSRSA